MKQLIFTLIFSLLASTIPAQYVNQFIKSDIGALQNALDDRQAEHDKNEKYISYYKAVAQMSSTRNGELSNWVPIVYTTDQIPIMIAINTETSVIGISNKGATKLTLLSQEREFTETIDGNKCNSYIYKAIIDQTNYSSQQCEVTLRLFEDSSIHLIVSYGTIKVAYWGTRERD